MAINKRELTEVNTHDPIENLTLHYSSEQPKYIRFETQWGHGPNKGECELLSIETVKAMRDLFDTFVMEYTQARVGIIKDTQDEK